MLTSWRRDLSPVERAYEELHLPLVHHLRSCRFPLRLRYRRNFRRRTKNSDSLGFKCWDAWRGYGGSTLWYHFGLAPRRLADRPLWTQGYIVVDWRALHCLGTRLRFCSERWRVHRSALYWWRR